MQIKQILDKHVTERLHVTGEDYSVQPEKKLLAKAIGYL
jgi:hypothetical protein